MTERTAVRRPLLSLEVGDGGDLGVSNGAPRLSWRLAEPIQNWRQEAYELAITRGAAWDAAEWNVVKRDTSSSSLEPWPFAPLSSRERAAIKVRACADGVVTEWSQPVVVEAGLLSPADWLGGAIAPDWPEDLTGGQPPALLRREFEVDGEVVRARLYITAHGLYRVGLNGRRVGDRFFTPGWSAYRKRLRYQAYDVADLLLPGANVLAITLADGWYRGYLVPTDTPRRNWYGTQVAAMAQLELDYSDGQRDVIVTDESWRAGDGPLRSADIYRGEVYDSRFDARVAGWETPGFDDSTWSGCVSVDRDPITLVAQISPPVRITQSVPPLSLTASGSGRSIVDFGQNLVGRVRVDDVRGERGTQIVIRHAEVLQDGELCVEPLRHADATDTYVVGSSQSSSWAPEFTFHGFRYAEVGGWPDINLTNVTAEVLHSDLRRTGWFSCSDPLINQLHDNAVWSMRGNFLDVPTDCPQRDERLGWTGDLQVFAPSACFLYDTRAFLDSWLADLAADQDESGGVPYVVPNPLGHLYMGGCAAAWSDAAVIVPWVMFQRFGDRDLLGRQYPTMIAFVECLIREHGPDLNEKVYQFGDWVDPRAPLDAPADGPTDKLLVAAAYVVYVLDLMAAIANLVGTPDDVTRFSVQAEHYRRLWRMRFLRQDGTATSGTVTAYALAVCFRLLGSTAERQGAGDRMAQLCADAGYRISTGFVGTPLVCDALTETGHLDVAYRLLTQTEPPSWLYPVTQGATTIWERWDSLMPNGRVNPSGMTSFNHYALGAVVDWLHRCVGGLAPFAPGYREVLIRPLPGAGITSADTRHLGPYGEIDVSWSVDDSRRLECEISVPGNSSAVVDLPIRDWKPTRVLSGQHRFSGEFEQPDGSSPLSTGAPWRAIVDGDLV